MRHHDPHDAFKWSVEADMLAGRPSRARVPIMNTETPEERQRTAIEHQGYAWAGEGEGGRLLSGAELAALFSELTQLRVENETLKTRVAALSSHMAELRDGQRDDLTFGPE